MNTGKTHLAVFGPFYSKCNFNRKEIIVVFFFFPHLQESIEVRNDFSLFCVSARCKLLRPLAGEFNNYPIGLVSCFLTCLCPPRASWSGVKSL